jgi:hypothetical protein
VACRAEAFRLYNRDEGRHSIGSSPLDGIATSVDTAGK